MRRGLVALALLAAACDHPLRAADPKVGVRLPRDHAAHGDAQTEWWHFHGHLVGEDGRRRDFFLGFVKQHTDLDRVALLPVRWFVDPFQVAYFTVTDRDAKTFHVREKHAFPDTWAAGAREDRLDLRHDSWRARARPDGSVDLSAATRHERLDLRLTPARPPALLGDRGYVRFPPRSDHYYYSIPRMTAEGTLTAGGKKVAVAGEAWLKHQWGFLYHEGVRGWVWFGAQLSTGQQLEIGLVYDHDWNLLAGSFAYVEEEDGALAAIPLAELGVAESGATWRSPRTGTVYPTGWILTIPGRGQLVLEAAVDGQEMVVFPANLWAGAMTVAGDFDGEPAVGDCFTEVVGLDEPFGRALLETGKPAGK